MQAAAAPAAAAAAATVPLPLALRRPRGCSPGRAVHHQSHRSLHLSRARWGGACSCELCALQPHRSPPPPTTAAPRCCRRGAGSLGTRKCGTTGDQLYLSTAVTRYSHWMVVPTNSALPADADMVGRRVVLQVGCRGWGHLRLETSPARVLAADGGRAGLRAPQCSLLSIHADAAAAAPPADLVV